MLSIGGLIKLIVLFLNAFAILDEEFLAKCFVVLPDRQQFPLSSARYSVGLADLKDPGSVATQDMAYYRQLPPGGGSAKQDNMEDVKRKMRKFLESVRYLMRSLCVCVCLPSSFASHSPSHSAPLIFINLVTLAGILVLG